MVIPDYFAYIDPGTGFTLLGGSAGLLAIILCGFGLFAAFFKKIFQFLPGSPKKKVFFLILVVILSITVITMNQKSSVNKRVIILGLDALSPPIIEELMAEGKLPNFSRLKENGSYRHLETTNPPQSPVAWAGFATGKNPGKHGVFDFIKRDPKDYSLELSLSKMENGKPQPVVMQKAFWDYTTEKNIPNVIINCPLTYPPSKINGRMLSGMGVPDILGTEGTFSYYTTEKLDLDKKDIGGKVFVLTKTDSMQTYLTGPRVKDPSGRAQNTKIPLKISLLDNALTVTLPGKTFEIKKNQWSDWKKVSFDLGFLKKAYGIVQFYLIETEPDLKLYVSPVNFDPEKPLFAISHPASYSKELTKTLGFYYTQGMPMNTWAVNEERIGEVPFLEQADEIFQKRKQILDLELGRFDQGVLFCYFEAIDIIQHMFWRYTDPTHPLYDENSPDEYKQCIKDWYIKMDALVGDVLEKLSDDDTLLILSDHGCDSFKRTLHLNTWLKDNGYLALLPGANTGGELLRDIDWSRTRAYAIGFGAIYINQICREKHGIVSKEEHQTLQKEIAQKLKSWQDEKYGKSVIHDVYIKEDIFKGPYAENAPDLYIGTTLGYRVSWQTALGAVPDDLIEDNLKKWSATHLVAPELVPGVFFSNKQIPVSQMSIYDLTPTILSLMGFEQEFIADQDFDGKPFL